MNTVPWIDSHAHLTSSHLKEDLNGVLRRAQEAGIEAIVNICTDERSLLEGLKLSQDFSGGRLKIYQAAAVHPHDTEKEGDLLFPIIEAHAYEGKLTAIGETGLDYHYTYSSIDMQKHFLRKHLRLALKCKLPVVIHCREAFQDLFSILDEEYLSDPRHLPGILHCFTGTSEEAHQVMQRGWFLSFSGIVTFKKSVELRDVVRQVPLERLLIETDAPYLAPQTQRGKPNEPAYLPEVAGVIAALKGIPLTDLARILKENTCRALAF